MAQVEMKLSDHPELGDWRIRTNVTCDNSSRVQTTYFSVQDYVPPKFEVTIQTPTVLASQDSFNATVCVKYTYGKPVKGNLKFLAEIQGWGYWDHRRYPKMNYPDIPIYNCTDVTIMASDLGWQNSTYSSYDLRITAMVTEEGTDVERTSTTKVHLKTNPLTLRFDCPRYFRPQMPTVCKLTVTKPDGTPQPGEPILLKSMMTSQDITPTECDTKTKLYFKNFTSDANGVVNFILPPGKPNVLQYDLQAEAPNYQDKYFVGSRYDMMTRQPTTTMQLKPWHSNCKEFMQIEKPNGTLSCGSNHTFMIYSNRKNEEYTTIRYQVMARDGIVLEGSETYKYSEVKGQLPTNEAYMGNPEDAAQELAFLSLNLHIGPEMAPKAQLLVHYVTGGEMIADSVSLDVFPCPNNKVNMEFSSEQAEPGQSVSYKVTSSPNCNCGISVFDKSIQLMGASTEMTQDKVNSFLRNMVNTRLDGTYISECCVPQKARSPSSFNRRKRAVIDPPQRIRPDFQDSYDAMRNAKVGTMSNLMMVTKPCSSYNNYYYGDRRAVNINAVSYADVEYEDEEYLSTPGYQFRSLQKSMAMAPMGSARNFGGSSGRPKDEGKIRTDFPPTWLWDMVSTNDEGVCSEKAQTPDTMTTWIGQAVCLNSEDGLGVSPLVNFKVFQPFFVSQTMPSMAKRGEIFPLTVSVFNYLEEPLAITVYVEESEQYEFMDDDLVIDVCVPPGETVYHKYRLKALGIGKTNVTTHAVPSANKDVCKDGQAINIMARDAATNSLVVEAEGFPKQQTISTLLCKADSTGTSQSTLVITPPEGCIPDTVRGEIRIMGDPMAPVMENMGKLIQMPTGCGEQNMYKLTMDMKVYQYMKKSGNMKPETENKLLDYMRIGYQRQLTYSHRDGSFSAFGEHDNTGSIMLTAFVVKGFNLLHKENIIDIDMAVVKRAESWLKAQQDFNGCMPHVGEAHNRAMRGSRPTITAYVLPALMSSSEQNDTAVDMALECITESKSTGLYDIAHRAYVLGLAKHKDADKYLEELMQYIKSDGESKYFEYEGCSSTYPCEIGIEITALATLTLMNKDSTDINGVLPMITWLCKHRNPWGGFYSTQDTLLALECLKRFAELVGKHGLNSEVTLSAEGMDQMTFHVNKDNQLLLQTADLPSNNMTIALQSTGDGCPYVQVAQFCNVPYPADFKSFDLTVTTIKGVERNCKKDQMTFCMRYNQKHSSNMALMQIQMPTGYSLDKESVAELAYEPKLNYRMYEVDGQNLALYFSKVVNDTNCFSVRLNQDFEVQDLQNSTVELYDYYQKENQISTLFSIPQNCTL